MVYLILFFLFGQLPTNVTEIQLKATRPTP